MAWKTCSVHIIFGIISYVCFLVAAVGGVIFLSVSRIGALKEVNKFRSTVQQVRSQLDLFYLSIGLTLLTVAIVLGMIRYEKTLLGIWDLKLIMSLLTWRYYFVGTVIAWILRFRRDKQANGFITWLSLWGLVFLIVNGIVVNYFLPSFHHFL